MNTIRNCSKSTNLYKLVSVSVDKNGNAHREDGPALVTRFATEDTYEDATRELLRETGSPVSVRVGRNPYFVELYSATSL